MPKKKEEKRTICASALSANKSLTSLLESAGGGGRGGTARYLHTERQRVTTFIQTIMVDSYTHKRTLEQVLHGHVSLTKGEVGMGRERGRERGREGGRKGGRERGKARARARERDRERIPISICTRAAIRTQARPCVHASMCALQCYGIYILISFSL
jgi:hypothetical protein